MSVCKRQGLIFCVVAGLVSAACLAAAPAVTREGLMGLLGLIVLLGMPHGALDTVHAARRFGLKTAAGWAWFVGLYLFPVAALVMAWLQWPAGSLIGFFALSAAHFAGDPEPGVSWWARLSYGGAPIVLPALLHEPELVRLLTPLTDPASAAVIGGYLHEMSPWWLAGVMISSAFLVARYRVTALEIVALAGLASFAPPLLSFTIYFCGMHSARHILRTLGEVGWLGSFRLRTVGVPLLATLLVLGLGAVVLEGWPIEARFLRLVFVSLAGLTVPHAILIDAPRFAGSFHWPRVSSVSMGRR